MQRRRTIAAAPRRTATEVWATICSLIGDTLERSSSINRAHVDTALAPLGQLARMLISAGHLENHPLVLVADDLWLEISTASGVEALTMDENLNPVPGGGTATDWTLHVPQVEPMAKLAQATAAGQAHLSADEPVEQTQSSASAATGVDVEALAAWARERA